MTDLTAIARDLERRLGDPHDPHAPMSYARVLELDEREHYPHEFVALLSDWGLYDWIVPEAHGGKAVNVEEGMSLFRLVARRDATTATAMVITSISYMPLWVAGSDEQRQYYADLVRGGGKMAWGLSERAHGSDVLANEMSARPVEGGWVLDGEKWTIGNGTEADVVMVFARTSPKGGPAGYSVFAVEKKLLAPGACGPVPDEALHGLRGIDMSGVVLRDAFVPDRALIGRAGQGLEIALKSGQFARVCINLIALSCTDTALRTTLDFATTREIFGGPVSGIPYSRRQLVESYADLLVADALTSCAVRGLQLNPGQVSVWSSVVKYFAPTLLEGTVRTLGVVLGARHWLRGHPRYGIFQKMARDIGVAGFADGNTVVNLKNIALQLERLLASALRQQPETVAEAEERIARVFDPRRPMPPYVPADQQLFSRGVDDLVITLPGAVAGLRRAAKDAEQAREAGWFEACADTAEEITGELERLAADHRELVAVLGRDTGQSAELFDLAKQYCTVAAAAACVHTYLHGRESMPGPQRSPAVLLVCLERLLRLLRPTRRVTGPADIDAVAEVMLRAHREHRLFSFRDIPLAPGVG